MYNVISSVPVETESCDEDLPACTVTKPHGQDPRQACRVPNTILLHKVMVQSKALVNFLWKPLHHIQKAFLKEKKRHDPIWNVISYVLYHKSPKDIDKKQQ